MQDVVDGIYDEFNQNLIEKIKEDKFYQYYFNLLETGTTYCQFFNRKLIKEVDEEWVEKIEKAISPLENVVENPRTFIEEDRQVVNVALAKSFTPESIRHLAQHTEMIDKITEDGSVEPNRIMNIFKEDSINTYENRFIYTLILELRTFVNKRTEVIFEESKDEYGVKLDLDSVIDNYTEVISYKSTIKIQEKQTDISNDTENVNIFSRISKIHKKVNDLASSGFMAEMSKYPLVKYPVIKTNAIAKNKDYKVCYELWNFIRSYTRVGYKVEMVEQDPNISMTFENDIYNMMFLHYALVRKHMTIKDIMNIDKPARDNVIGINLIKQFIREVVNEFGLTESELKTLLLSETAKAWREKREKLAKKEELQRRQQGEVPVESEEVSDGWEEFTGNISQEATSDAVTKKLSKKQIARMKKEKKEQEKQKRLQKFEEDRKRVEKLKQEEREREQAAAEELLRKQEEINKAAEEEQNKKESNTGIFGKWKRKKEK